MKIHLAPMEGLIDVHLRNTLTGVGGFDLCVTEFIRVVDELLPRNVYQRLCPELERDCRTLAGTPVHVQLLGGVPEAMARNALRAVEMGAPAIDINFGCPSKFVNRKAGGAVLLKEPERVGAITRSVREAVPSGIPVTAKIRLGYDDTELTLDIAHAVEQAGADWITVHARTKVDGYKPPARWKWLTKIRDQLQIPVVANGDINSVEDYRRCFEISGCEEIMLGRGAIATPDLARQIRADHDGEDYIPLSWPEVLTLLIDFLAAMRAQSGFKDQRILGRVKQWLTWLKRSYPEADELFEAIRLDKQLNDVSARITACAATSGHRRLAPC